MPRPPQTESRSTPRARAASSRLKPSATSPRFPDGVKTTRWALNAKGPALALFSKLWSKPFPSIVFGENSQAMRIVFCLEPQGGSLSFAFQVLAARDRFAAPPLSEIGVFALRARVHRRRVDRANKPIGQLAFG